MRRIEGLPAEVSIESLTLRDDAYAVLCLICGGGGAPASVQTCRGEFAPAAAWSAALRHHDEHERERDELLNGERRRLQGHALGWSQAQADAMRWADREWLHWDGAVFYKKDMTDPRAGRGRTVAKARVQALITAGFLHISTADHQSVQLTRDGRAARRAWIAAQPEPTTQESRHLRPLIGGEEEARRDADRAAQLVEAAPTADVDQDDDEQPAPVYSVTAVPVMEDGEGQDDEAAGDGPCGHVSRWLYVAAEEETRQLRAYLTCGCDRGPRLGNFSQRTAVLPAGRTVAAAQTRTAQALADRNDYEVTGAWTVLDERTKRAPVRWTLADVPAVPPVAETVTAKPVTETAAPVSADDPDEAYAAWIDRQAEHSDRLAVDGPGIIGPGTHITYRDGRGPGTRSKHSTAGTVVRISRGAVTWRPYGAARVQRTPLVGMRVTVPRSSAAVDGHGRTAGWRRWSLADHLAYARRRPNSPPADVAAAELNRPRRTAYEAVQLPLWPTSLATPHAVDVEPTDSTPNVVQLRSVTGPAVTENPTAAAGLVVVIPCSGAKLAHPAPAGELYRGSLHTMCRRAADALTADGGTVVVLSSRYGLVPLNRVIAPYELRMGETGSVTAAELREQATQLGISDEQDVTVLAGAAYTTAARTVWPHAAAPLDGSRGIGEMRQRLAELARTGHRQTA